MHVGQRAVAKSSQPFFSTLKVAWGMLPPVRPACDSDDRSTDIVHSQTVTEQLAACRIGKFNIALWLHDRKGVPQFASIQGDAGEALLARSGLKVDGLATLLLIDGQRSWEHTGAIFRVLGALGWPWGLAWIGWQVPVQIRDSLYRPLARNRYRVFGRVDKCPMPPSDYKSGFMTEAFVQAHRPTTR